MARRRRPLPRFARAIERLLPMALTRLATLGSLSRIAGEGVFATFSAGLCVDDHPKFAILG